MKIEKPGEYRMRNGFRAWVRFRRECYSGNFPWIGEREMASGLRCLDSWSNEGGNKTIGKSFFDIVSPISTGESNEDH